MSSFQVDSPTVVKALADYQLSSGTTFLGQSAASANAATPRLPIDAGQIIFAAESTLSLDGSVISNVPKGGQGSLVDIASTSNILIAGSNANVSQDLSQLQGTTLVLSSTGLSNFNADSLLIGGYTGQATTAGTPVTVTTGNLVVDNSGDGNALSGPDIILVANDNLMLDAGARVEQGTRTLSSSAPTFVLGNSSVAGSGDGALLRVSSDSSAKFSRLGVDSSKPATLTIGEGATISGTSLALDSTNQTELDSTASLAGTSVDIGSGQISIVLNTTGTPPTPQGLVLSGAALAKLQSTATNLSLLSYNSIDMYGNGTIGGGLDSSGQYPVASLALHAAAIRGDGGNVIINAQSVSIDDGSGAIKSGTGPSAATGGSLTFNAGTVQFGTAGQTAVNGMSIQGYDNVAFNASGGILLERAGSTTTSTGTVVPGGFSLAVTGSSATNGNLTFNTPLITGASAANQTISAAGAVDIEPGLGTSSATVVGGLGANLDLIGQSITVNSDITLASGTLKLEATTGDLKVGQTVTSDLKVAGTTKTFNDETEYTSGGNITLASDKGSVSLGASATVDVSSLSDAVNAGSLTITAPQGSFLFAGNTLKGGGGTGGQGGTFNADVATINTSSSLSNGVTNNNLGNDLAPLETLLNTGGFAQSQSIRVRGGTVDGVTYNDVYIDGNTEATQVNAGVFNLSTDTGSIIVTGTINASNVAATDSAGNSILVGGTIDLEATGSVVLTSTGVLDASGQNFSNAGKGGAITLAAGSYTTTSQASTGAQARNSTTKDFAAGTAVVDVQQGSTIDLSVVASSGSSGQTVNLASSGSSYLVLPQQLTSFTLASGTPGNDGIIVTSSGTATFNGVTTSFAAGSTLTGLAAGTTIKLDSPGSVEFASGGTGGSIPIALGSNTNYTLDALGDATGTLHLTAPRTADNSDVQIDPIKGTIIGESSVVIEGNKVYAPPGGLITSDVEGSTASKANDGSVYGDALGFTANTNAILTSLLGSAPTANQLATYQVTPGAELINTTGDLTLTSTWDLSTFRFGPDNVAGDLTLRAAGNVVFSYNGLSQEASLSDGFTGYDGATTSSLWEATLMSGQSWSYQITAGADFNAADSNRVESLAYLNIHNLGGSVTIGSGAPALPIGSTDATANTVPEYYQVIRTGTGDITISAGQDVQLDNPLATIYTAGTQADPLANFFTPNLSYSSSLSTIGSNSSPYQAAYSQAGGNVTISALGNIGHYLVDSSGNLTADSTKEMPTSWLYRQGFVLNGQFAKTHTGSNVNIAQTSWWVDFDNFFEGVGALGGGNVSLIAGKNVDNVDAVVPTNARMPGTAPSASALVELGGGDLLVKAGQDISGGVYYVERGQGTLEAGGSIHTNSTRATLPPPQPAISDPTNWLPTTLFLGKGSFNVNAEGSVVLGPVANPFLLPQGINNSFFNKTYFSTYSATDSVNVSSLAGDVTLKDNISYTGGVDPYAEGPGSLASWYSNIFLNTTGTNPYQPWLNLVESSTGPFDALFDLMPPTLNATSFSNDINIVGSLVLSPSATGTVNLIAGGSVNGYQPFNVSDTTAVASPSNEINWGSATINLSDADPSSIPSIISPLSFPAPAGKNGGIWIGTGSFFSSLAALFNESGSTNENLQTKDALHTAGLLHAKDSTPIRLYAQNGDISGLTLYSGKFAQVEAGQDISDISFYVQNDNVDNITLVSAGRDLIAYDPGSALRNFVAGTPGNEFFGKNSTDTAGTGIGAPTNGDIQISGPGTLEVLAGRNLNLGVNTNSSSSASDGIGVGITSVGNQRDPFLPFGGADIVTGAGINDNPNYQAFITQFLSPGTSESAIYLPDLGALMGMSGASNPQIWAAFNNLSKERQDAFALDVFYLVLRDSGRDHNNPSSPHVGTYTEGFAALSTLYHDTNLLDQKGNFTNDQMVTVGGQVYTFKTDLTGAANEVKIGDSEAASIANLDGALATYGPSVSLTSREIKTENGGNISLLVPGGQLTVGFDLTSGQPVDQGILTVDGGNINIFTDGDVVVGTSRIFTLNGGNETIWSTIGNIAAGSSSKTVQSAPPTRVVIDPQSGDVKTDLSGLATGGGIGVLEAVAGAQASDVDLIAPFGAVNAGDAGIRASGNLNIAAVQVLNAGNIQVGGKSSGVPTTTAPNVAGIASASSASGAASNAASEVARQQQNTSGQSGVDIPSIITVEVLGYGGGEG